MTDITGWRKKSHIGRPVTHRTWLSVWMEWKKLSNREFAKILMVAETSIENWRSGKPLSMHNARLIKAFFPDCPVNVYDRIPPRIQDKLPICSRNPKLYRYIFGIVGLLDGTAHAGAIARARGISATPELSEPSEGPVLPGEPNSSGV